MRMKAKASGGTHQVGMTWESFEDLGKPAGVTVFPNGAMNEDSLYVCAGYVMGRPFTLPGNRIGTCAGCGGMIQMRPHAPQGIAKICVLCALQEGMEVTPTWHSGHGEMPS